MKEPAKWSDIEVEELNEMFFEGISTSDITNTLNDMFDTNRTIYQVHWKILAQVMEAGAASPEEFPF